MEFIFKMNRSPRIGIKYTYDFQAVRAYEALFGKHGAVEYDLRLEPRQEGLKIALISADSGFTVQYPLLAYKITELQQFQRIPPGAVLQFVHVYPRAGILYVARPFKQKLYVSIRSFEIIVP